MAQTKKTTIRIYKGGEISHERDYYRKIHKYDGLTGVGRHMIAGTGKPSEIPKVKSKVKKKKGY